MNTEEAFARGEAARARAVRSRVFDWNKAAKILRERGTADALAGLRSDMEWTGGPILREGKPVPVDKTYTYLASVWATPIMEIDHEEIECWAWVDECGWNANTYWPQSALDIFNGQVSDERIQEILESVYRNQMSVDEALTELLLMRKK